METKQKAGPVLGWMSRAAGKAKGYIALLVALQAVLSLAGVLYAILFRGIVNAAVAGDRATFFRSAAVFVGFALAQILLRAVGRFTADYTGATMENRLKQRLFTTLLTKDYASVAQTHSGEWMNRLTSDVGIVSGGLVQLLPGLVGLLVKLVGALAAMVILERRLAYILVPVGLLMVLISYAFRKALKRLHIQIREADGRLRVFLQERLGAQVLLRTFAQEEQTARQAGTRMKEHLTARMRRSHLANFCGVGFSLAMNGAYVLCALYCGYGMLNGTMSYGNLAAVLQLTGQIQSPFASLSGYLTRYYALLASAERLMEAENFPEDCPEPPVPEAACRQYYQEQFTGIRLEDVSFTYQPAAPTEGERQTMPVVLSGWNLELPKGAYVAFTGPSGCGKSTALKLLLCLYPLDGGRRVLQSRDGEQPLDARWRSLFAYVPQGNQLLCGTIREIIAFADPEKMAQEERLRRALEIACADGFVDALEKGLDTPLGERGAGLSEGEMQRIAIARAIFSEHPILLLDEATSALDEATEARLLANLRAMTDRTVVIVTHRPAALAITDRQVDFGALANRTH